MKAIKNLILFGMLFLLAATVKQEASAASIDVQVHNNENLMINALVGDSGQVTPVFDGLTDTFGNPVNTSGLVLYYSLYEDFTDYYEDYEEENGQVLTLTETGAYTTSAIGASYIYVYAYLPILNESGLPYYSTGEEYFMDGVEPVFKASCYVEVKLDTSSLSLEKDKYTIYCSSGFGYGEAFASADLSINSGLSLGLSDYGPEFFYSNTKNKKIQTESELDGNTVHISLYVSSKKHVEKFKYKFTVEDKSFTVDITLRILSINKRGLVNARGKKSALKIYGLGENSAEDGMKVEWSSSKPKVVSVNKNGGIKCRKKGNAVITAKVGDYYFGCAVSVVSSRMLKVVKRARYIGTHWKYSQPLRMRKGYYDCSSLVWKSYSVGGKKICNARGWAPVAADIGKWSKSHGKVVSKKCNNKQVDRMIFNPGDLLFKTGKKNGRYKGIYHVEMFRGYAVSYYDEKGKPHLNELWGAREEGYSSYGYPMYRPYKNF